jgi:hypothetical protein
MIESIISKWIASMQVDDIMTHIESCRGEEGKSKRVTEGLN